MKKITSTFVLQLSTIYSLRCVKIYYANEVSSLLISQKLLILCVTQIICINLPMKDLNANERDLPTSLLLINRTFYYYLPSACYKYVLCSYMYTKFVILFGLINKQCLQQINMWLLFSAFVIWLKSLFFFHCLEHYDYLTFKN